MKDYFEIREKQLEFYRESEDNSCPVCFAVCEVKPYHERDSTYDIHVCPKCGWGCKEHELWNY